MPILPLPQQEKLACARSCGFKRVSGKGVFKGYKLTQGGEWAGASRPSPTCVKAPFFGAHNLIHGLKALIPCWAWVSEGVAVLKTGKKWMNEGQEKSPFSDSLATEENGLGFENLNQRLQRYAGAKSRARYG